MSDPLKEQILELLDQHNNMTIATLRPDGFPQATITSYVHKGLILYFGCSVNAQKAKNIQQYDKISLTISKDWDDWSKIKSLSMGAFAERVDDLQEFEEVRKLLFEKFPQVANYEPDDPETVTFFRITPIVISVLDYSKGFGHTELYAV